MCFWRAYLQSILRREPPTPREARKSPEYPKSAQSPATEARDEVSVITCLQAGGWHPHRIADSCWAGMVEVNIVRFSFRSEPSLKPGPGRSTHPEVLFLHLRIVFPHSCATKHKHES